MTLFKEMRSRELLTNFALLPPVDQSSHTLIYSFSLRATLLGSRSPNRSVFKENAEWEYLEKVL